MNLHEFMHICIVGVLHQMIPPFSMFQDGRSYILFPGEIITIIRWRIFLSLCIGQSIFVVSGIESIQQNNLVLCISRLRSILIIPSSNLGGGGCIAREEVLTINLVYYS